MKMERRNFLAALTAPAVACLLKFEREVCLLEGWDPCSTTLVVSNPQFFTAGDILHIPRTGEYMMVRRIFQENFERRALKVLRGLGNSTTQPVKEDDSVWILGRAKPRKQYVEHEHWDAGGRYAKWVEEELLPTIDLVKEGD
jgi:hypothetical protein